MQRDGTLLAIIVDQEAAQVQGLGDLAVEQNEPDYSLIESLDPDELIQYIIKLCHVHCDRSVSHLVCASLNHGPVA